MFYYISVIKIRYKVVLSMTKAMTNESALKVMNRLLEQRQQLEKSKPNEMYKPMEQQHELVPQVEKYTPKERRFRCDF